MHRLTPFYCLLVASAAGKFGRATTVFVLKASPAKPRSPKKQARGPGGVGLPGIFRAPLGGRYVYLLFPTCLSSMALRSFSSR